MPFQPTLTIMPFILLIRHAENDYVKNCRLAGRLPDVHLNENGRLQVQTLVEKLTGAPLKAVYSSPLERALETAQPLASAFGLEVEVRPGLIELDVGEWQGKSWKGLRRLKIWKTVQATPSRMRFPGGESFSEAQFRVCQEIDQIASRHEAQELVACVSHGDPIKLAVAHFIGLPLDSFQRLVVDPASITTLQIGETSSRLLSLNYEFSFNYPKS